MALVLLDRPALEQTLSHRPTDVAAWTCRRRGGAVHNWRSPDLDADTLIAPWARAALADGDNYADLLYSELADLHARQN